jgi:hypothetical protein
MSCASAICTHPDRAQLDARLAEANGDRGILKPWKRLQGAMTGHAQPMDTGTPEDAVPEQEAGPRSGWLGVVIVPAICQGFQELDRRIEQVEQASLRLTVTLNNERANRSRQLGILPCRQVPRPKGPF